MEPLEPQHLLLYFLIAGFIEKNFHLFSKPPMQRFEFWTLLEDGKAVFEISS
jgi:hypothetical protein